MKIWLSSYRSSLLSAGSKTVFSICWSVAFVQISACCVDTVLHFMDSLTLLGPMEQDELCSWLGGEGCTWPQHRWHLLLLSFLQTHRLFFSQHRGPPCKEKNRISLIYEFSATYGLLFNKIGESGPAEGLNASQEASPSHQHMKIHHTLREIRMQESFGLEATYLVSHLASLPAWCQDWLHHL